MRKLRCVFVLFAFLFAFSCSSERNAKNVSFKVFDGDEWYTLSSSMVQSGSLVDLPDYKSATRHKSIKSNDRGTIYKWTGNWSTTKSTEGKGKVADLSKPINSDTVYYAQYTEKPVETFEVKYNVFNGSKWVELNTVETLEGDYLDISTLNPDDISSQNPSGTISFKWTGDWTTEKSLNPNILIDQEEPVSSSLDLYAVYDRSTLDWKTVYFLAYDGSSWKTINTVSIKEGRIKKPEIAVPNVQKDSDYVYVFNGYWSANRDINSSSYLFDFENTDITDDLYLYAKYSVKKIANVHTNIFDGTKWNRYSLLQCPEYILDKFYSTVADYKVESIIDGELVLSTYSWNGKWSYDDDVFGNEPVEYPIQLEPGQNLEIYANYSCSKTEKCPLINYYTFDGQKWNLLKCEYTNSLEIPELPVNVPNFIYNTESSPISYSFSGMWSTSSDLSSSKNSIVVSGTTLEFGQVLDLYAVYDVSGHSYPIVNYYVYTGDGWSFLRGGEVRDRVVNELPTDVQNFTFSTTTADTDYVFKNVWSSSSKIGDNLSSAVTAPINLEVDQTLNLYAVYDVNRQAWPVVNYYKYNGSSWQLASTKIYRDSFTLSSFDVQVESFEYSLGASKFKVYSSQRKWSTSDDVINNSSSVFNPPYELSLNQVLNLYAVYSITEKTNYTVKFMKPSNLNPQSGASINSYITYNTFTITEGEKVSNPTYGANSTVLKNNFRITTYIGSKVFEIREFDGLSWSLSRDENGNNSPYDFNQKVNSNLVLYPVYPKYQSYNYANLTPTNWMSFVSNYTSIYAMTIPGTHESVCTSVPFSICQKSGVKEQLNMGGRVFDLRLDNTWSATDKYNLALWHGPMPQLVTFKSLLETYKDFLIAHPSEMLIIFIKPENDSWSDIENGLTSAFNDYSNYIFRNTDKDCCWPSVLGEARGKMVFVTRNEEFDYSTEIWGWSDNRTFGAGYMTNTMGVSSRPRVQDYYNPDTYEEKNNQNDARNIGLKVDAVRSLLNEAADSSNENLYINFTSAYIHEKYFTEAKIFGWTLWSKVISNPLPEMKKVADTVNPMLASYFYNANSSRKYNQGVSYGLLKMDYITKRLAQLAFLQNKAVMERYLKSNPLPTSDSTIRSL